MTVFANVLLVLAVIFTLGLAWCLAPQNVPGGNLHDRMGQTFLCALCQLPRWLCVTGALLVCVSRGVAPWPEDRGAQVGLLLIAQVILGIGCLLCVIVTFEDLRNPRWMSRCLMAVPFVVPMFQIAFAAWLLNPGAREGIEPHVATMITRVGGVAFAAVVVGCLAIGVGAYAYEESARARSDRETQAAAKASDDAAAAAEHAKFGALSPADPLAAWMPYAASQADNDPRIAIAVAAVARRPNLAAEIDAILNVTDLNAESAALTLVDKLPPANAAGLAEVVRAYGRRLKAELDAAAADANPDRRRDRFAYADPRATSFMAAAIGLRRAGVDVRADLIAIVDVARPVDCDGARDIVRIYDHHLAELARAETK